MPPVRLTEATIKALPFKDKQYVVRDAKVSDRADGRRW